MAANSSGGKSGGGKQATPSPEQVVATFQRMRQEQRSMASKAAELEMEINEHSLVIDTLKEVDPTRKCYRLVGGVLVERTVKEVLPALENNKEQISKIIESLNTQMQAKGRELTEYRERYNIRLVSEDDKQGKGNTSQAKESEGGGSKSVLTEKKTQRNKGVEQKEKKMADSSSEQPREGRRSNMEKPPVFAPDSSGLLSEDQFLCSICLDVFTDPVTTPCGHNFCMKCIRTCWGDSEQCHCPFCKEKFTKRPELKVNTAFREVVDHFKKKSGCLNKPEVLCDACIGAKQKALKSCLDCGLTFCKSHLEPHDHIPKLKKHRLINPVEKLQDYICQRHERPLELFCRDDQNYVCQFCTEGDHKNHNTVLIEEESGEKKSQLEKTQTEVLQMIQDRLKKIKDIKHSVELRKRNTEKEKADSVEVFTALICSIERSQAELLEVMEENQKAAERQVEDLIKELEQEITELKRRDIELEQLSHTEDHLHFLQIYPSLCRPPHTNNWTDICIDPHLGVETVRNALSQLQKSLNERLTETLNEKIRESVSAELKRVQQFAVDVTLDADTAHPNLMLSDDGKQVRDGDTKQHLPDNPERFTYHGIIFGKEGFSSGRFYYEVQVSGKTGWDLGVARESINRKGEITLTPKNGIWTVILRNGNEYKACGDTPVHLSLRKKLQKMGVFVDYEEGLVSFYDVESRSHIYSLTGQTFTEKLYPYFNPCNNDGGKNSAPLIISPVSTTE
ncbi:hypothetical protein MHYP_G00012870 [Metynnis hypsauchen]